VPPVDRPSDNRYLLLTSASAPSRTCHQDASLRIGQSATALPERFSDIMTSPAALSRNESQASSRRSTSLGSRLFRSKSGEALGERKSSAGRLKKKTQDMDETAKLPQSPPRLPNYNPQPLGIQSFGGENYKPRAASREYTNGDNHTPPVPPLPLNIEKEAVDPYARTESMTHRELAPAFCGGASKLT
jgi:hypothetical protein